MDRSADPLRVRVDDFVRAETDSYFAGMVARTGLGVFTHARTPVAIDKQTVVRMNRDTLYSSGVFDLDASPVAVTLPVAARRFMSLQVISEDHYTSTVVYEPGPHLVTREMVGTRYVCLLIRTLVDPDDESDVRVVHALQDAISVDQHDVGRFEVPNWDPESLGTVRDTLRRVAPAIGEDGRGFGTREAVDPIHHLIGTATGWGGNPASDARYVGAYPPGNDGTTVHRLTVNDVPVDGFWSISVYNQDGFFEKNTDDAYSINNLTAALNDDGSVTVQFGGSKEDARNHLPITPGWNYVVRLYRPRPEILDGSWTFPKPAPVS